MVDLCWAEGFLSDLKDHRTCVIGSQNRDACSFYGVVPAELFEALGREQEQIQQSPLTYTYHFAVGYSAMSSVLEAALYADVFDHAKNQAKISSGTIRDEIQLVFRSNESQLQSLNMVSTSRQNSFDLGRLIESALSLRVNAELRSGSLLQDWCLLSPTQIETAPSNR